MAGRCRWLPARRLGGMVGQRVAPIAEGRRPAPDRHRPTAAEGGSHGGSGAGSEPGCDGGRPDGCRTGLRAVAAARAGNVRDPGPPDIREDSIVTHVETDVQALWREYRERPTV